MTLNGYREAISAYVDDGKIGLFLTEWINQIRDEITQYRQFSFMLVSNTVPYILAQSEYDFREGKAVGVARFSGTAYSVIYDPNDPAQPKQKLSQSPRKLFELMRPRIPDGIPTSYQVLDGNFTISDTPDNNSPAKSFDVKYYAFPDRLVEPNDEKPFDVDYSYAVISGVCLRSFIFLKKPDEIERWRNEFTNEISKMIAQDTGTELVDIKLRGDFPGLAGAQE